MSLDNSDFKVDPSKVFGGISKGVGMLDPESMAIDMIGDMLGLPPAVKNAAKVGIGVVTGNPLCIAAGAAGLAAEATKEEPATTEMAPPKRDDRGAVCCQGYASTATPPPPVWGPSERFSMDSPEFQNWCPSNPYLRQAHDEWMAAKKNGGCGSGGATEAELKNNYETQLKYALERDPQIRGEFERHFNCRVIDPHADQVGPIMISRLMSGQANSPTTSSPGSYESTSSNGAAGGSSGSSGTWSTTGAAQGSGSSIDGIMGKLGNQMSGIDRDIDNLKNQKGELTEAQMMDLQQLMQKKNQMFTLMSTLLSIQNQMAMTAIQNMKG